MTLSNHFENLASRQLTASAKRKHDDAERRAAKSVVMSERDAPMKGSPMEEARDARSAQMAGYRRHKAKEQDDLMHGPYGAEITALVTTLKGLTIDSADQLVAAANAKWIRCADLGTRQAVLSLIADAILRLRIRCGMPPFDDAIFYEPPTAFQIVRKNLMGV